MQKNLTFIVFSVVLALFSSVTTRADDSSTEVSTTETRLREALRSTTLEWHQAQEQITSLQASQAENDKAKADLQAKVDAFSAQLATLTHQANDEKAASDKLVADLNSKITEQATQIEQLNETLKQWEDAYNRAVQIAAAKEAERVKFAINAADLQRIVDDRESKNFALYKLGSGVQEQAARPSDYLTISGTGVSPHCADPNRVVGSTG